jgi:hypothetical protein
MGLMEMAVREWGGGLVVREIRKAKRYAWPGYALAGKRYCDSTSWKGSVLTLLARMVSPGTGSTATVSS